MISKQQAKQTECTFTRSAGQITRRTLLKQALSAGIASSIIPWMVTACDSPSASPNKQGTSVTLNWLHEHDDKRVYDDLVKAYNLINTDGIKINPTSGPASSSEHYNQLMTAFKTPSSAPDLVSLDVVWTDDLVSKLLLMPLSKHYGWPGNERNNYLPVPLKAATSPDGEIWAAPFRTDVSLLYYRTDLPAIIPSPPKTWAELSTMAKQAQATRKTKYGYVWQGDWYEGLVCNFIEVLSSFGGTILDPNDPKKVTVYSPQAVQALSEMVTWVGTISPANIITFEEQDTLDVWLNKESAFMRNWAYAIALSSDASKPLGGKFAVAPLPAGTPSGTGHSCAGGWQLGINAASSQQKQDAAMHFIKWMLSEDAQQYAAIVGSWAVALQSIYTNTYVNEQDPFFSTLKPISDTAVLRPRPRTASYQDVSRAIQNYISLALKKQLSPDQALQALQSQLQQLV